MWPSPTAGKEQTVSCGSLSTAAAHSSPTAPQQLLLTGQCQRSSCDHLAHRRGPQLNKRGTAPHDAASLAPAITLHCCPGQNSLPVPAFLQSRSHHILGLPPYPSFTDLPGGQQVGLDRWGARLPQPVWSLGRDRLMGNTPALLLLSVCVCVGGCCSRRRKKAPSGGQSVLTGLSPAGQP